MNHCKNCGYSFEGRSNQDFCCDKCRYSYNNARVKEEKTEINAVLKILLKNREILKELYESGSTEFSRAELSNRNYNHIYLTHQLKAENGTTYIFCFDYGISLSNNILTLTKYDRVF